MLGRLAPAALAMLVAACASIGPAPEGWRQVRLTPDDPAHPKSVRFDVPSALLFGLPGDYVPLTLQARVSTRELAARELGAAGYCPNGFQGPEAIFFPGGDRAHSAFVVRCNG